MRYLVAVILCLMMGVGLYAQSPCNNQTSVTYQGYEYDIVEIAGNCWFQENLQTYQYSNGENINTDGDWLDTDQGLTNGQHYNLWAVQDERGLCPSGWHVSTYGDWSSTLSEFTNYSQANSCCGWYYDIAHHYKSQTWDGGANTTGFTATSVGFINPNGNPGGGQSQFWASGPTFIAFYNNNNDVGKGLNNPQAGSSVRCVTNQLIVQIPGCTDPTASNYDPDATEDDGSCCYGPGGWVQIGESINGSMLNTQLGRNVAMSSSGDIIAVAGGGGGEYFPVKVYENINNEWTQLGQDLEGGGDPHKVSINAIGNILAIGRSGASNTGKLSIYEYDDNSEVWVQLGGDIIGEPGDYYGGYISLSKEMLLVAASFSAPYGENGGVRVFEYSDNEWAQLGGDITGVSTSNILPDNQIPCLSADGMTIAIGSLLGNTESTGLVSVYVYNGGSWSQIGQTIEGEMSGDESGTSISLSSDGQIMAIGAPQNNTNGDNDDAEWNNAGHVRVFSYSDGYWSQLGSDIDGLQGGDYLGNSVSLSNDGTFLAAGAPNSTSWVGYTNVYKWDGLNWNQIGESIDGQGNENYFGRSVALSGDGTKLVVGAPENNVGSGYVSCYSIELPCNNILCIGPDCCISGTQWDLNTMTCVYEDACSADIAKDGFVAVDDLLELLSAFGSSCDEVATGIGGEECVGAECCGENTIWCETLEICIPFISCPADLNEDESVGSFDLLVFLPFYGGDCEDYESLPDCEVTASPWMCGDLIEHEGYDYSTVLIGEQCWFSENCRYLPEVYSAETSTLDPIYYVYNYEGTDVAAAQETYYYATYGVLYNWPAVMTEGICPTNWHVPSDGEWQTMEMALGMSESVAAAWQWRGYPVGDYLKSTSGWINGGNGSNSSGFTGLPGGCRWSNESWGEGDTSYFWTTSTLDASDSQSVRRKMDENYSEVNRSGTNHDYGFSARCIKD